MPWRVQIHGPEEQLLFVSVFLQSPELSMVRDADDTYIVCKEFERLDDPSAVFAYAEQQLDLISRAGALQFDSFSPFSMGPIQQIRDDRTKVNHVTTKPEGVALTTHSATVNGVGQVAMPNGSERRANPSEPTFSKAMRHISNEHVDRVLDLLRSPSWGNLYMINERMRRVIDDYPSRIQRSDNDIDRFRQTANHYRHDPDPKRYPLPPNPPTHSETVAFFKENVARWLDSLDR